MPEFAPGTDHPFGDTACGYTFGHRVVDTARLWKGTRFQWDQSCRGEGCDCKGLVAGVARDLGRPEGQSFEARFRGYQGRVPEDRLLAGFERLFDRVDETLPGDLLLLRVAQKVQHMAIFSGAGADGGPRMIHTFSRGPMMVVEQPIEGFLRAAVHSTWRWRDLG